MSEKKPDKSYPSQFDKVREITDKLEAGIQALFDSETFKNYLKTLAKFHDYSLNNTILIAMQKPDATLVAGYTAWQKNFGRQVQKGEQGIRILAPTPYKKQMEVAVIDPSTGQARMNPDGTKATEMKEIMVPAFKVVSVFDVSQTDGKPLPSLGVNELSGNVAQYDMFFEALKRSCPVPIGFEQIDSGAKGYYHTVDHRIALQEGMSQVQTIKTLIHEMTHQKLHSMDPKELPPEEPKLTRSAKEVEAESVAYTVAQHYGIETSDYSFAYIAGWSHGKDTPELKASLDRIRRAADEMITGIDEQFLAIHKEKEAEVEALAGDLAVKVDALVYDYDYYGYADAVDDREVSIQDLKDGLLSRKTDLEDLIQYLQGIADDEDYGSRAAELIADAKVLQGRLDELWPVPENGLEPEKTPVPGLQENGLYRYYSTQRPVDLGTYPKPPDNKPVEIHNYDKRISVEGESMLAWGWLEYPNPLTEKQLSDYELQPAPARLSPEQLQSGQEKADIAPVSRSDPTAGTETKSVLQDLAAQKSKSEKAKSGKAKASRKSHKPKEETR